MKENRSLKIFISCALGAGIGALIALQLNHYFWWLGMLAGGFVGYISYEFEKVVVAVPQAWRYAVVDRPRWRHTNRQAWKDNILAVVCAMLLLISWSVIFITLLKIEPLQSFFMSIIGIILVMACFLSINAIPPGQGPEDAVKKAEQGAAMLNELRTLGGKIRGEHE